MTPDDVTDEVNQPDLVDFQPLDQLPPLTQQSIQIVSEHTDAQAKVRELMKRASTAWLHLWEGESWRSWAQANNRQITQATFVAWCAHYGVTTTAQHINHIADFSEQRVLSAAAGIDPPENERQARAMHDADAR